MHTATIVIIFITKRLTRNRCISIENAFLTTLLYRSILLPENFLIQMFIMQFNIFRRYTISNDKYFLISVGISLMKKIISCPRSLIYKKKKKKKIFSQHRFIRICINKFYISNAIVFLIRIIKNINIRLSIYNNIKRIS